MHIKWISLWFSYLFYLSFRPIGLLQKSVDLKNSFLFSCEYYVSFTCLSLQSQMVSFQCICPYHVNMIYHLPVCHYSLKWCRSNAFVHTMWMSCIIYLFVATVSNGIVPMQSPGHSRGHSGYLQTMRSVPTRQKSRQVCLRRCSWWSRTSRRFSQNATQGKKFVWLLYNLVIWSYL